MINKIKFLLTATSAFVLLALPTQRYNGPH